jgi:hypothetical protein
MRIKYKQPYWLKFQWDITEHHDNQYVTEFDKEENKDLSEFLLGSNYIITCNFQTKSNYKRDEINMVFGKPGKNIGLSYNSTTNTLAFEFWTKTVEEDKFNMVIFDDISLKEIENGITISIVREKNKFILYKNFVQNISIEFENDLIDDYKDAGFYLGCSFPSNENNRQYYGEVEINHFSILSKNSNIENANEIFFSEPHTLVVKNYYDDILCLFDFNIVNNIGVVYDESKNCNFLEKVPKEYIK